MYYILISKSFNDGLDVLQCCYLKKLSSVPTVMDGEMRNMSLTRGMTLHDKNGDGLRDEKHDTGNDFT